MVNSYLLKHNWSQCPQKTRLLGLDLGSKTIGVAVSNSDQSIATPFETIKRSKFKNDMQALGRIVRDYDIGGLIFGYPVNMDGTIGPQCDKIMSFVDEIKNYPQELGIEKGTNIWISLWDERLSTRFVHESVDKYVDKRKTKQNAKKDGVIDKMAAQLILQGALDFLAGKQQA